MTLDHKKLAVIHIVKKELGLSDRAYSNQLEKITGVRSAKDLDESGFRRILNYFVRSRHYRSNKEGITFRQRMYIMDLREKLGWKEAHFVNFLKKYYGKEDIRELSKKEGSKVIISLKKVIEFEYKRE